MKIYIFVLGFIVLFAGCAPQYAIRNQYIPPANLKSKSCLKDCNYQKQVCKQKCSDDYSDCLSYAYERAKQIQIISDKSYKKRYHRYQKRLSNYNLELFDWQNRYDTNYSDWRYFNDKCSKNGDRYACDREEDLRILIKQLRRNRPREPREPRYATFNEILAQEQSKCSKNCGCDNIYNSCFVGCGGEIVPHKICIRNCD